MHKLTTATSAGWNAASCRQLSSAGRQRSAGMSRRATTGIGDSASSCFSIVGDHCHRRANSQQSSRCGRRARAVRSASESSFSCRLGELCGPACVGSASSLHYFPALPPNERYGEAFIVVGSNEGSWPRVEGQICLRGEAKVATTTANRSPGVERNMASDGFIRFAG